MTEITAYNEALSSGQYQKPGGLLGKYDNVRRFWEDEELGIYLRPYLESLIERKKECGEKLRVLDLGCGGGDGYEFLTSINSSRALISEHANKVINPDILGLYRGVDINEGLIGQAKDIYGRRPDLDFVISDINAPDIIAEEPYDLYLANYGTLSHNNDEQTITLLSNIAANSRDGAIIITDWLGRFSYEWQTLWTRDFRNNQWMDYVISYLSADGAEGTRDLTSFSLRIMGREEAKYIHRQASRKAGGRLALRQIADRSSLVGRHIDTRQYNPHAQPFRRLLNSLFEPNVSTDLDELLIRYVPAEGFDEINGYYQRLAECWNYLIAFTGALMEGNPLPPAPAKTPAVLRRTTGVMKRAVQAAAKMNLGDPRSSLIEPQMGYCLRELEIGLQKGLGCGHGLVAVFEVTG